MKVKKLRQELALIKNQASSSLPADQVQALSKTIHYSALAAGSVGAGLAQIPGSDSALIVPIQINMIRKLGKNFGQNLSQNSAEIILGTGLATMVGRYSSQLVLGWIPGAGNLINATTAGLITEILGWSMALDFAKDLQQKKMPD